MGESGLNGEEDNSKAADFVRFFFLYSSAEKGPSPCIPNTSAELTPEHTKTGGSCTKAAGKLSELNTCKLCGRRSTMNGRRGQRPSCPSGSASAQARSPETQSPLTMMRKAVRVHQLRSRKKRKRRRRRRKRRRKR